MPVEVDYNLLEQAEKAENMGESECSYMMNTAPPMH
jgi:hypothetical protein